MLTILVGGPLYGVENLSSWIEARSLHVREIHVRGALAPTRALSRALPLCSVVDPDGTGSVILYLVAV